MARVSLSLALSLPLAACLACPSACGSPSPASAQRTSPCDLDEDAVREVGAPRNVILFVGDGMGSEHLRATRRFAGGDDRARLAFDALPVRGRIETRNASGTVTDSAAAATAMATGRKVRNGVVSVALPGDGRDLVSALELHAAAGKRTGLITKGKPLTDATPAAFGAHARARTLATEIARDLLEGSRPNVLLGARGGGLSPEAARAASYAVAEDAGSLERLRHEAPPHVAGLFDPGRVPPLPALTGAALDLLEEGGEGLFLVVENEAIDSAGHRTDLRGVIDGVLELHEAVDVALAWARAHPNTLVIVTADHETGGLRLIGDEAEAGKVPGHTWEGAAHTAADVPLFATGPGSALLEGKRDNTCLFHVMTGVPP